MKLINFGGRAVLRTADGDIDVATASSGRFGPDVQQLYERWAEFRDWSATARSAVSMPDVPLEAMRSPVPRPRQVFAVGLNYRAHADETKLAGAASRPLTFTKFPSSITGPTGDIALSGDCVDWEVELVAVIGTRAHRVSVESAWSYVAGLTVGQDLSDRAAQLDGAPPQFSLGKSFPGYAPMGPVLVSPDELADRDDLRLTCRVNGETVQDGRTSAMLLSVPELVASLSAVCPLWPGDVIFTGTPEGVGMARTPPRYLRSGDVLETTIEGIGTMTHTCIADPLLVTSNGRAKY